MTATSPNSGTNNDNGANGGGFVSIGLDADTGNQSSPPPSYPAVSAAVEEEKKAKKAKKTKKDKKGDRDDDGTHRY